MKTDARDAWQKLYSKHGLQYGGGGDLGPLEPLLKPGMIALDAGCGDGKTTEILARRCDVVACDFSREALVQLRAQRSASSSHNMVECDIRSLPFESEKFEVAVCVQVLSHLLQEDRRTAASELSRILSPEGFLFVEGFGRGDIRFGVGEEVEESSFMRGNGILTHYYDEGEIQSLFTSVDILSDIAVVHRVTFGPAAGKRELRRVLMRKHGVKGSDI